MFIQIQNTPNPNSLKFIPGKKVSEIGPIEVLDVKDTNIDLIKNILSIKGVRGLFLYEDFLSVNKNNETDWKDIKHIVTSYIKIRPAVSRDGGDITLSNYKDGVVTVKLQGSCSGCPSSTITLKKGVENLLTHYVPEVKEVKSI